MKLRDWFFTAICMAALQVSAFAVDGDPMQGSIIGGEISGFLKKDNSPYLVKETLVVPEGKALVIEAGTEIYFNENTGVDVRGGSIAVMGERNNLVVMGSAEGDKPWNGIFVLNFYGNYESAPSHRHDGFLQILSICLRMNQTVQFVTNRTFLS